MHPCEFICKCTKLFLDGFLASFDELGFAQDLLEAGGEPGQHPFDVVDLDFFQRV